MPSRAKTPGAWSSAFARYSLSPSLPPSFPFYVAPAICLTTLFLYSLPLILTASMVGAKFENLNMKAQRPRPRHCTASAPAPLLPLSQPLLTLTSPPFVSLSSLPSPSPPFRSCEASKAERFSSWLSPLTLRGPLPSTRRSGKSGPPSRPPSRPPALPPALPSFLLPPFPPSLPFFLTLP
jgi:hypothetical protein